MTACPHCGKPINPAAMLARRGAGKPRIVSRAERRRMAERLAKVRALRWPEYQPK
jgi:uncharacterized protein (UPF0212 family)